jgi:hypothetical protein
MKVHLIPDENLDSDLYTRVLSLLQAVPGVNKFYPSGSGRIMLPEDIREEQEIPNKDYFEKQRFQYGFPSASMDQPALSRRIWNFPHVRVAARWRDLFHEIQQYRLTYLIPEGEFAILLTPTANKKNWFAVLDENRPFNGFIHTDEWEHFISCDPAFPIAFEVIALTIQRHIFENYSQIERLTHERAIGCISDLCMRKSDIILKMRTADICPACMTSLQNKLSVIELGHALSVLESLRIKMLYAQNFRQNSPPSRLAIKRGGRIYLTDYENIEVRMPAMEKALYLLFLNYPEGIYISSLCDYREELYEIYSHISTRGMREDMVRRINELTNTLNDQVSVKISRIKRAFTEAIGVSLADHYIIQGENAERKKIKLSRNLVIRN